MKIYRFIFYTIVLLISASQIIAQDESFLKNCAQFNNLDKQTETSDTIKTKGTILLESYTQIDKESYYRQGEINGAVAYTYLYLIRIFPCPVVNLARIMIFGIEHTGESSINLKIYDINGSFVKDISYAAEGVNDGRKLDFYVDLSFLSTGIYIIEMISNDKRTTRKFIKL